MLEKLQNKLKLAVNFPSPPAVAQHIIDLASDPDIDVMKVATAIAKDPGLTAKVLRVANSPIYSKQRKSDNLRQALVVLGLNAATTLALSFSLVGTYKGVKSNGIDYNRYWRRTILCASAARAFGTFKGLPAVEEIFLAALLQDIAVIAIDRTQSDFYATLPKNATHADIIDHEMQRLGTDHAAVGSWLLKHWMLADSLCRTVAASHDPAQLGADPMGAMAARCVALGSECVEVLLARETPMDLSTLPAHAKEWLDMDPAALSETMAQILTEIPETERLFDMTLLDTDSCTAILEQARELLLVRNLKAIEEVSALQQSSDYFRERAADFEDKNRRDPLTGVFNRGHMEQVLEKEFQSAIAGGWPLSIVFVDLDDFKKVNDTHGHAAGDTVLMGIAKLILDVVRDTDYVVRYGGDEFLMIFPGIGLAEAQKVCERLLARLRSTHYTFATGGLTVTTSLGLASHSPNSPYRSVAQLIEAADRSVYLAKAAGRDQLISHESPILARTA